MRNRSSSLFTPLSIGILALLISIGLVACGSGQGVATGATPTTSTQSPTATQPSTTTSTPGVSNGPVQNCGTISMSLRGAPESGVGPQKSGNCFWQAFQQCQPATLVYHLTSIDTVTTHTFTTTKNGSACAVTDHVQHSIVPRPPTDAGTFTCASVSNTAGKLDFNGCGTAGNIVVPTGVYNPGGVSK